METNANVLKVKKFSLFNRYCIFVDSKDRISSHYLNDANKNISFYQLTTFEREDDKYIIVVCRVPSHYYKNLLSVLATMWKLLPYKQEYSDYREYCNNLYEKLCKKIK